MLRIACAFVLLVSTVFAKHGGGKDVPCVWKSLTGASYDLRPLTLTNSKDEYYIQDGDIPCTPELEPSFDYEWNFCANVNPVPRPCSKMSKTSAVAFQYAEWLDGTFDCYIIGRYDPNHDDLYYQQIDPVDPSKGVSIRYPDGEKCTIPGQTPQQTGFRMRSATIDVMCENEPMKIVSAQEPMECEYHLVVKSYHGCPTSCPVTKHGLCNSHGHCAYDKVNKESYCYCNSGWSGKDCATKSTGSSSSYSGESVQMGFLITLMVIVLVLVGVVGLMGYKIQLYRKQQEMAAYQSLSTGMSFSDAGGAEMVDRNGF